MEFVILDFETTGLDPESSEIIEIGALRVAFQVETRTLEVLQKLNLLVKPAGAIPRAISELTGITHEMLAEAPPLEECLEVFRDFLSDSTIVAHNSQLEQSFLDRHVSPKLGGLAFDVQDSIHLFGILLCDQSSHSMDTLRAWGQLSSENAHRALQDVEDLFALLVKGLRFLEHSRPHLRDLVTKLHPEWWWSWYFHTPAPRDPLSFLTRSSDEEVPDLRKLSQADVDRDETPWTKEEWKNHLEVGAAQTRFEKADLPKRAPQLQMTESVLQAARLRQKIAIEAPTGTGKSLAYLVPTLLSAQKSQLPWVVSTHSKSLQDQLLSKDLPQAIEMVGGPLQGVTVKGQENYLCLRKLAHEIEGVLSEFELEPERRYAVLLLSALASLRRPVELDQISPYLKGRMKPLEDMSYEVRSHHTTTQGPPCKFYRSCHFFESARRAHTAQILIANHALTFRWPEHLPKLRQVVFDEAHHLEDQLTDVFSSELTEDALLSHFESVTKKFRKLRSDQALKLSEIASNARLDLRELSEQIPHALDRKKRGKRQMDGFEQYFEFQPLDPDVSAVLEVFQRLDERLKALERALKAVLDTLSGSEHIDPGTLDQTRLLASDTANMIERCKSFLDQSTTASNSTLRLVYWNPKEGTWRSRVFPLDVRERGREFFESLQASILSSATLTAGSKKDFVTSRIGYPLDLPLQI
jgi:ATP-dependent DNA helicase DinG